MSESAASILKHLGAMPSNDSTFQPATRRIVQTIESDGSETISSAPAIIQPAPMPDSVPQLIAVGGAAAKFAWDEFIYARIRNPHTRAAYAHSVRRFLCHCETLGRDLHHITPRAVATYLDDFQASPATKKLHLAGLRHFFDTLVTRHVIVLNPALSVRGERLQVIEGKTPEITVEQARHLLGSIDTSHVVGLRDRAIIGILIYTAARVGAVAKLRCGDFYNLGDQYCLRFTEKGGQSREIPIRHDLRGFLRSYLDVASLNQSDKSGPLFRTTTRRTRRLTPSAMTTGDISRMIKRRLRAADLPLRLSPHSFRVATITDLLDQGVSLADVQNLAGHADPRTTRLYDRRQRCVTRNIVERISV